MALQFSLTVFEPLFAQHFVVVVAAVDVVVEVVEAGLVGLLVAVLEAAAAVVWVVAAIAVGGYLCLKTGVVAGQVFVAVVVVPADAVD